MNLRTRDPGRFNSMTWVGRQALEHERDLVPAVRVVEAEAVSALGRCQPGVFAEALAEERVAEVEQRQPAGHSAPPSSSWRSCQSVACELRPNALAPSPVRDTNTSGCASSTFLAIFSFAAIPPPSTGAAISFTIRGTSSASSVRISAR